MALTLVCIFLFLDQKGFDTMFLFFLVGFFSVIGKKQGFLLRTPTAWVDVDSDYLSSQATTLFISHAHSDHLPKRRIPTNKLVIGSPETIALAKHFKKLPGNHSTIITS